MNPIQRTERFYDFVKHHTTLSSGSIVITATFADKFVQNASCKILLAVSIGAFICSVMCSVPLMVFRLFTNPYVDGSKDAKWEHKIARRLLLGITIFFLIGLMSLGVFAVFNL